MARRRIRYSRNEFYRLVLGFVYIAGGVNLTLAEWHRYLRGGEWSWMPLAAGAAFVLCGLQPIFERTPSPKTFTRLVDIVVLTAFMLAMSVWLMLHSWMVAAAVATECLLIGGFCLRCRPRR